MSIRRSDEHDLTVFPTGPTAPEPPAAAPAQTSGLSALEAGTTVHEFRILKLIGEGGFGIVYLAEDQSLDRTVALKEYMPSELAERAGGTSAVQVRSQRYADTFEAGMRSFINEARLLARFDHPSLLKVYRFFQANGTAYMAMPFYEGQTLKAILRERTEPPDERWLRRILYQLLDALEIIHRHECYHRDIAPDNVLMLQNDTPILLDFGAARRVIGDMTQNLTVILKPGYAPIEQYAEDPDMKQGPWTDIYALASVVHFALTRKPPPASIARAMNDRMEPLAQRLRGQYSEGLLTTIDKALALKPQDRPQSVASLRAMLLASDDGTAYEELPPAPLIGIEALAPPIDAPTAGRGEPATQPRLATRPRSVAPVRQEPTVAAPRAEYAAAAPRNRLPMIGLAAAVPVALGFLWWLTSGSGEPPPAPTAQVPVTPKSASATPPARVEPPQPATRPEPPPSARVAKPAPPPPAPPPAVAVAPKPVPTPSSAPAAVLPKPASVPSKIAEAPPPKAQPQVSAPPPPVAAKKGPEPPSKAASVVETKPPVAPLPARVETPRLQRSEEVAEVPAPRPPPPQLARVEPKPEPAPPPQPAAKSEPPKPVPAAKSEAPKPPVEVARVEPPPPPRSAVAAAEKALIGRYTGKMEMGGWPVVVTLDISAVQDGTVTATARQSAGPCAGSYRLTGTVRDDALRVRSTHAGGRGGDCSFGFRGSVQGARLVGTTGNGVALEFSR